jgi:long-chain acyl-CoA synthetase
VISRESLVAELTAPGGVFEVGTEPVRGRAARAYVRRRRSLPELLRAGVAAGGDRVHVVYGSSRLTFADVFASSGAVAAGLSAEGLRPGDRVAVLAANSPEWIVTFWATVRAGGVLAGLNGWWSADEVVHALRDCGARFLVADPERHARVADRLGECPALEAVYVVGESFARLSLGAAEVPDPPVAEDDPAVILYTSGTTGRSRGAVHSHRGLLANCQNMRFNAALASPPGVAPMPSPIALVTVPFFHVSGCHAGFVAGMDRGSTVVLTSGRFDPEQVLELIERERVTQWSTVPAMVARVLDHVPSREYDVSSLASIGYGGAPSGEGLQRRVRERFPGLRGLHIGYGLTETCGSVTINSGAELAAAPQAAGRALPIVELTAGEPGSPAEVRVRGSQLMLGYWPLGGSAGSAAADQPIDVDQPIDADGWLATGDIGYLDAGGVLHLTDRAKDIVIRGGENVYCAEIENRLADHPGIAEAAVVGVPDPTLGELVAAVVVPRPGAPAPTADEVRDWVGAALARFKVPERVLITERPLPRNAAGKLVKSEIRAGLATRSA